ncbi:hypothetical protein HPP92_001549 [Vanilla planifolia]|uniref:RING-type domain-containing protein n=1 Tax=Vanilla planifolia TaxID=51239 RepID=A0A835SC57_VANPL|nr:hypothetical protein HPP92_001549 [Vanilla planifolia]
METLKKLLYGVLTCSFALCGAGIGAVAGAFNGQTTETGIARGMLIGAVAGAVVAIEILESCFKGELQSKVTAIFGSLFNGKIYREWVSPAVLMAYQWQMSTQETSFEDTRDIFDVTQNTGLLLEIINRLPEFMVARPDGEAGSCAVCLQDFSRGERARKLPSCGHFFHLNCIDRWLLRHGSCPFCRKEV